MSPSRFVLKKLIRIKQLLIIAAMTIPFAADGVAVVREAAFEAAAVRIKRESKRALAARLCPPATENTTAHRASDRAVLCRISSVNAADLIARARQAQRAVVGKIDAGKISARCDCRSRRRLGRRCRGDRNFEREGRTGSRRVHADGVVTRCIKHALPTAHVLCERLDVIPVWDNSEKDAPGGRSQMHDHLLAATGA